MPRPPLPPQYALAWSFTRHRLLRECERAVYWTYFGSRGQGLPPGDPDARRAFALRHLTTLLLLAGTVVHGAARRIIDALLGAEPAPDADELYEGARFVLNQAWRTSQPDHIDRFWRYPGVYVALQEVVYHGALREGEVTRARERVRACLRALTEAPVFDDLRACAPGEVWLPPDGGPVSFTPTPGQIAWGAVDVAYRHHDLAAVRDALSRGAPDGWSAARPGPSGPTWCVADFKTGERGSPELEALQLGAYSAWMAEAGYPRTDGLYLGRIIDLRRREDRWYLLDEALLDRVRAVVAADGARMRERMADPVRAVPMAKESWPLADDSRTCRSCRFQALCLPELAAAAADRIVEERPADAEKSGLDA